MIQFIRVIFVFVVCVILYGSFNLCMNKKAAQNNWDWTEKPCYEIGFCKQGEYFSDGDKLITVNKENCIKYKHIWNEKKLICIFD